MADYPEIAIPDPLTGEFIQAQPTGRYRVQFEEPVSAADAREFTGDVSLDDGPTLVATANLATLVIEDIRTFADSISVIRSVLPVYVAAGHEFTPLPGKLLVRAANETEALAILDGAVKRTLDELDARLEEEAEPRGALFAGLFEYGIRSGFKEPSVEIGAYANGDGLVCMDAEHPDSLAIDPEEVVESSSYDAYFTKPDEADLGDGPNPGTVAILDAYFELRHEALNFRKKRGITVLDFPIKFIDKHGTSCAGVVGANPPEEEHKTAIGELPGAELIAIRFFERGLKAFAEVALARAIEAAVDQGADVISISFGTPVTTSCALGKAIAKAVENDVVVVAGSGNAVVGEVDGEYRHDSETLIVYPAAYADVIAVGAAKQSPSLQRCTDEASIGDPAVTWSSRYEKTGEDIGVDVVAQGLQVATTDLWDEVSAEFRYWDGFLGTSAAAPIVAGLAARIRREHQDWSAEQVRGLIQCLAKLDDSTLKKNTEGFGYQSYSYELGFGWIEQSMPSIKCASTPDDDSKTTDVLPVEGDEEETEDSSIMTTEDRMRRTVVRETCHDVECDKIERKSTYPKVEDCLRPLSIFLRALADRKCCELLYDFMEDPFRTARACGVPYQAAVWLGSKDWDSVNQALLAENNRSEQSVAAIAAVLDPIWVKAR